ncbi:ABC transporter substrate-binding protein [Dokdonia pacifica]|uniref:Peptide/nickel transport system substrate-binding protein n=1 Tax=Dokdonia pacifica TaxID=1627892 RepID=A0A239C008_9FLAO|nr:ABC transporter substrate-binding protein [Dokdonia pacifica]SNS13577.1 peptide/nickel transport system substrate-binding protein [Dokdonia pacifica]
MSTFKNYFLIVVSIQLVLLVFSCSSDISENKDHLVFRYNEQYQISTLDPAFARNPQIIWPTNQLFNGLVQLDDNLNIQPDIAKTWQVSDDALQYTFTLRDDVLFHKHAQFKTKDSTRFVNASDFVYSFGRLTDPAVASPGGWVMNKVDSYKALNDSTFTIQLKQPFPAFLGLLSMRYCSVVPKEVVDFYGNDFRSNPIGTGPFKFKRWEEGVKLVLRKNNLYYEFDEKGTRLPYLEAVAITFLPDKQSEFLQFAQGNIDFLNSLDPSYKDELLTASGRLREKYQNDVDLSVSPQLNTEYIGFYLDSSTDEVQSELLRKAVNYGFDRQKMITYLRNGIGEPAEHGFIPMGLPGFDYIQGYAYNPKLSRKLIKQYKKESGNMDPMISIGTNSQYLDICEYIQRELQKAGLRVEINVMPPSTLRQMKSSGDLDAFRASWIADYPDAENYLSLFYSKNFTPNGPNYTHFKSADYDSIYEHSLSMVDVDTRKLDYIRMDSIIIAKAPIIPLYYDQVVRFTRKNISGLTPNPQNFLVLKRVKKSKI